MFENPRRGRHARNFTTHVPKILDLKSSSEQIFFRKLSLGAPVILTLKMTTAQVVETLVTVNNSPIQDYGHLNDQTQPTYEMTLSPFTSSFS